MKSLKQSINFAGLKRFLNRSRDAEGTKSDKELETAVKPPLYVARGRTTRPIGTKPPPPPRPSGGR
ncbi:hypothetical protein VKT23_019630 [Stygiomarasmius scandens]|uniref:Uncharacterized protein n=1 Tax=Marasmiellus scandens TaxID=2682957 RepID=A0ABR1IPV6_9AGAR